ncbi:hypothetical protein DNTS_001990 [Danionella cerebrum]|uniref:Uncharacterized protein n=1 Tax=Danionella cerebrum TaxID=2873325 RepID=A0A553RAH7_9TELE|nr:hypothetical protein DNTS_001990 [Danionella translucida]
MRASSLVGASESPLENLISFWPEWNEYDVNAERWDAPKTQKDSKTPVVMEIKESFDLTSANEHLLSSELMRWVISECYILWKVCNSGEDKAVSMGTVANLWRPWDHIYSLCKVAKDHNPLYNGYGKYVIKLYWMGAWRKITVDDYLPFDKDENLLLPATANQAELWPMLLTKALLKLASTDAPLSGSGREFGEFSIIHCLTGWIPEIIPLKSWYKEKIWGFLRDNIPWFQLEEESMEERTTAAEQTTPDCNVNEFKGKSPTEPTNRATGSISQILVCASTQPTHLMEKRTTAQARMAGSSETLRQYGLSQHFSHPVLLTCTRDFPLVAPPKSPSIGTVNSKDEELRIQKLEQFVEVSSPFINCKLMTMAARDMERGVVNKHGYNSNFISDAEMDGADDNRTGNDVNHTSRKSPETTENTQAPAEDEKKDNSIANVIEQRPMSGRDKGTDIKHTEKLQSARDSSPALPQSHDALTSDQPLLPKTWVDLHDFTKSFQTLLIFHKPNKYAHECKTSHFKSGISSRLSASALSNAVASSHSVATFARQSDLPGIVQTQSQAGKIAHFLFVDSLLPVEIVIGFSALVHYGESLDNSAMSFKSESLRFCEQALIIAKALGRVISYFSDPEELPFRSRDLERTHGLGIKQQKVFGEAVYHMFCSALERKLTSEELFAVQTLTGDPSPHGSNDKDGRSADDTPERWNGRQATDKEMQAATVLQAGWKGYLVREILTAARPGTKENLIVAKTLQEMWASVESDLEKHAVFLLSHMVANGEGIEELYDCRADERHKLTFIDFSVPVPDTTNSWNMLLIPKVLSPLPSCIVHVINNDTLQEIPRVFNLVEPYTYTPNKGGYTVVAEALIGDAPAIGGKWRLRLIGSREPLPQPAREVSNNNFSVDELKGYYFPNEKNIICRHLMKVFGDHNATVQFQTSKSDVYIKLSILDQEREVTSSLGKGHVIIPVYCFLANGSCVSQAGTRKDQDGLTADKRVTGVAGGKEMSDQYATDTMLHKYCIQAEVLQGSWPLDESLLPFIEKLRDIERNELKVFGDILDGTPIAVGTEQPKSEKSAPKSTNKAKEKDKLASKSSSKVEQSLDTSRPHWTLRVVSDQSEAGGLEVKKDTEKLEEIRAMKLAWEAAEPGRASKNKMDAYRLKMLEARQAFRCLVLKEQPFFKETEEEMKETQEQVESENPPRAIQPAGGKRK